MKKSVIFGAIAGGVAGAILAASVLFGTWIAFANKEGDQALKDYEAACKYVEEEYGEGYRVKMLPPDDDDFIEFLVYDEQNEPAHGISINRSVYVK